jgi:ketosteroid isomerase-like protein
MKLMAAATLLGVLASSVVVHAAALLPADRQEILDLISRYSYAWDRKDADGWVALFANDATLMVYRGGVLQSAIRSNAERLKTAREFLRSQQEQGVQMRHLQTNTVLERLSDGSVQGDTMVTVLRQEKNEPTPKLHMSGTYHDRFEKTPSGWKFARRELRADQK